VVFGDGLSDQGCFFALTTPKPVPKNREGHSPDDYLSFWAVSAGRRV
jgi:hypothetical protein